MAISDLIDIHAHVLPGIDDGPYELTGSLELARAAVAAGTTTLAATPHLRVDFPGVRVGELQARCQALQDELERSSIDLRIVGGAEVSLLWALEASADELRLASYDRRGTDLLIETPTVVPPNLDDLLYGLRARGFRITLAHPERSDAFEHDRRDLAELVRQGVLLQLNAESLVSSQRRPAARRLARTLCVDGLAHVLASDGHRASSWRPVTSLRAAFESAVSLVGRPRAEWMARHAPSAILAGAPLPEAPPIAGGRGRSLRLR